MSKKFDLTTHHRNTKGQITRKTPYTLIIKGGQQLYVRDGVVYLPDGSLAPEEHQPKVEKKAEPKVETKVEPKKAEKKPVVKKEYLDGDSV